MKGVSNRLANPDLNLLEEVGIESEKFGETSFRRRSNWSPPSTPATPMKYGNRAPKG